MAFPLLSKKLPFSVSYRAGVSPLCPCWPFYAFLTQYLPVSLPCHLCLVPLCCLDSSHWLRLLLLSPPWSVSFGSTETDPTFSISSFSHIFLSPSIAPLILLIKNWFLKGRSLPNFKVLGHCHCVEASFIAPGRGDGGFLHHSPL